MEVEDDADVRFGRGGERRGFDDVLDAASTSPPLTTVRQPLEEMTRAMADLLLRRIDDAEAEGEFVVCPTNLIRRASA